MAVPVVIVLGGEGDVMESGAPVFTASEGGLRRAGGCLEYHGSGCVSGIV
jgi:hypothetical protein